MDTLRPVDSSLESSITRRLVSLIREHLGNGPAGARTTVSEDVVVCVLTRPFTRAERTLLETGRGAVAQRMRKGLHEAMREIFVSVVEEETGRDVVGFMADVDAPAEVAALVFLLGDR